MYFRDRHGLLWFKTNTGFQNIGLIVKEKAVTFKRVESMELLPSSVVVPTIENPIPITLRQAISQLGITEQNPLQPLENLNNLEVIKK